MAIKWVDGIRSEAGRLRGDSAALAAAQKQIEVLEAERTAQAARADRAETECDAVRAAAGQNTSKLRVAGQTAVAPPAASTAAASAGCPFSGAPSQGLSRRGLLAAGAASIVAAPLLGKAGSASAGLLGPVTAPLDQALGAKLPGVVKWKHAEDQRGLDAPAKLGPFKEARFGRMFKDLAAFEPADDLLIAMSQGMAEDRDPQPDIPSEYSDNPNMPSGFIYLGQFIDHDMTHDTTPLGSQSVDPLGVTNFESPQFDLSSMYGGGPAANPELYEADHKHLRLEINKNGYLDLPRNANGVAIIGDPRNDENLLICQLHVEFIRLHNYFLDNQALGVFAIAKQLTLYHYQWIIVHDFLPHVVGQDLLDSMIFSLLGKVRAKTLFYRPGSPFKPMMPVEYSAAAYRWGHSGIRPEYETHANALTPHNPTVIPIFDGADPPLNRDLRGNRPLFVDAIVDWNYFFDINGVSSPDDRNLAHLIDTQVSRPLFNLPDSVVAHVAGAILSLPERNLLRGKRLGLPSGQDVAARMKQVLPSMPTPLTNAQLDDTGRFNLADGGWGGQAPLWFYCLRETELGGGSVLGPVMGRIVAEVILGLLQIDVFGSYWNAAIPFTPVTGPTFNMDDMFKLTGANIIDPTSLQPINTPGAFHEPSNQLDVPRNPENFAP